MSLAPEDTDSMSSVKVFRDGLFDLPSPIKHFPADGIHLIGTQCGDCGTVFYPSCSVCSKCLRPTVLQERKLGTTGTLYTFTVIFQAPPPYKTPYAIGYVDLPEGVRVFSMLAVDDLSRLRVGAPVQLILDELWRTGDEAVIGYKFSMIPDDQRTTLEVPDEEG